MRVTVALSALMAVASAGRCRPITSSSTLAATVASVAQTSASGSDIVSSTTLIIPIVDQTVTSEPETISTSTMTTEIVEPTETPSETSASMLVAETSTALAGPEPIPTVAGFCIKGATPDTVVYGQRLAALSPNSNLVLASPADPNYGPRMGLFNLDISTGALTLNNTAYEGYQVHAPSQSNNQVFHVIRFTTAPAASPLTCFNREGRYSSGSILKCSAPGNWDGGPRMYSVFSSLVSATAAQAWQIRVDGYQSTARFDYDVAMFFGDDCL
ncbi:hypothetical protein C8A01DRAFT_40749 [Parachaetomium inaequale]|uniref:Uncharacterized protein n=1 Tax=Parachaetomium inaequale TaxID=2588326 RepID=A0AAN6P6U0_9PEZI|nr:hypothetical protein C8A01DRAFT_40749 [Parachaetomium inaequale]